MESGIQGTFLVEAGIQGTFACGIRDPGLGIRKPKKQTIWNQKFIEVDS